MKIFLCDSSVPQTARLDFDDNDNLREIAVLGEFGSDGAIHPASPALLAGARELVDRRGKKTELILIGDGLVETARRYYADGADRVFVYDDPLLKAFDFERYAVVLTHFLTNYRPSVLLVNNTPMGRALASHAAAFAETELTDGGCFPVGTAFKPDPARKGELIICEIPDELMNC